MSIATVDIVRILSRKGVKKSADATCSASLLGQALGNTSAVHDDRPVAIKTWVYVILKREVLKL